MARNTAAALEIDIVAAFRKRLYYGAPKVRVVAIPNAARRTQWEVGRAKKEGMAPGFPDVMVLWPYGNLCFLEFKAPKGEISPAQEEWGQRLTDDGFRYRVCRSADEAVDFLRSCGAQVMERAV